MFHKWFSGPANAKADDNPSAFWVDWNWIMRYGRAKGAYTVLTQATIFNDKSKRELGENLKAHNCLTDKRETFNFIEADWRTWKDCYNQHRVVNRLPVADGLQVAMGLSLCAFLPPDTRNQPTKDTGYMLLRHQSLSTTGSILKGLTIILVGIVRKKVGMKAEQIFLIPTFATSALAMAKVMIF